MLCAWAAPMGQFAEGADMWAWWVVRGGGIRGTQASVGEAADTAGAPPFWADREAGVWAYLPLLAQEQKLLNDFLSDGFWLQRRAIRTQRPVLLLSHYAMLLKPSSPTSGLCLRRNHTVQLARKFPSFLLSAVRTVSSVSWPPAV